MGPVSPRDLVGWAEVGRCRDRGPHPHHRCAFPAWRSSPPRARPSCSGRGAGSTSVAPSWRWRREAEGVQQAILEWTDEAIRDDLCLLVLRPRGANTAVA